MLPSLARVVVVGGGCVGSAILHGLAQRGWTDCILLERTQLTAGSTWHAAGLLPTYIRRHNVARMLLKTMEIYEALDAASGHRIGLHKCGTLRVANTQDRMDEFWSYANVAQAHGNEAYVVSPGEIYDLWPLLEGGRDVLGGLFHPKDAHIAPADVTQALANAARELGSRVFLNTEVTSFERLPTGEWRVKTAAGDVTCEHVVTATGNYARQTAAMVGLDLPAIPIVHQYWVTDAVPELQERRSRHLPELPILRDERFAGYLREEGSGLLFGPYEDASNLELFAVDGVPTWFGADLLPENFAAVEQQWTAATEAVPALGRVGIKRNVRGPFQMTADDLPLAGPAWGLHNFWLAEGVPGGILWGGALGHYLSAWIADGDAGIDMSDIDPRRFGPYANKQWTREKVRQTWGGHADTAYPDQEHRAARPSKMAPSHDLLSTQRAVWGELSGWEVPLWYAPMGASATDAYSFRRPNYFKHVGAEACSVRQSVGLVEMSCMTKFEVSGPGASAWLDFLLANRLPAVGRVCLSHHLTTRGTVRSEHTVTRLGEELFYLVSTPRAERYNWDILMRALPSDGSVDIRNVSSERGCLTIVGPAARQVLQPLAEVDLSNDVFPWMTCTRGSVGLAADVRILRVNYSGELGWELHHPISHHRYLAEEVIRVGKSVDLRLVGFRALESLRLEKSYRSMYRDMNADYTALESGLDRFVCFDKMAFHGRAALLQQRRLGLAQKLVTLKLESHDSSPRGGESVYHQGELVGRIASAGYSHQFACDLALVFVRIELATPGVTLRVPVLNSIRDGVVIVDSPYDPTGSRIRN